MELGRPWLSYVRYRQSLFRKDGNGMGGFQEGGSPMPVGSSPRGTAITVLALVQVVTFYLSVSFLSTLSVLTQLLGCTFKSVIHITALSCPIPFNALSLCVFNYILLPWSLVKGFVNFQKFLSSFVCFTLVLASLCF